MQSLEKIIVAFTLLALVGLSLWLDATFNPSNTPSEATTQPKGEDYYIEGVRISGRDDNGIRFVLIAQRQHRNAEDQPAILCLLYTSPSPRDLSTSRMPSSA